MAYPSKGNQSLHWSAVTEHSYMVNGKSVDKETFNEYVSQFAPNLVDNEANELKNDDYTISVKYNLDVPSKGNQSLHWSAVTFTHCKSLSYISPNK